MNEAIKSQILLVIIIALSCAISGVRAQEPVPPLPSQGQSGETIEEVIVTGSNIPTSEEVGPNPVDVYRRDDITRLGVRTATDLVQKLPEATGPSINENVNTLGNGQTEIDLRGLASKETLVLQDGRRVAPTGIAGFDVALT